MPRSRDLKRKARRGGVCGRQVLEGRLGRPQLPRLVSPAYERVEGPLLPELIIDHCRGFNNAVNGQVDPHLKPNDAFRNVGRTGRILGVEEYAPVTRDLEEIMTFSDVFRTYDSAHPLTTATMIERAVWELLAADKSSSRVVINTEDER